MFTDSHYSRYFVIANIREMRIVYRRPQNHLFVGIDRWESNIQNTSRCYGCRYKFVVSWTILFYGSERDCGKVAFFFESCPTSKGSRRRYRKSDAVIRNPRALRRSENRIELRGNESQVRRRRRSVRDNEGKLFRAFGPLREVQEIRNLTRP